jgi:cyclopropane fatty-acyl-phospholipid synthase-like methyltransferase
MLAYDRAVNQREGYEIARWKHDEREGFLHSLLEENISSLVDIGSGPGVHAVYFRENGIEVTCVDLSPENVKRCQVKGFYAQVLDLMNLESLGIKFRAAFAMNSLLHVPRKELTLALSSIRNTLMSTGLFYWGQYGGEESEGVYDEDAYEPKRFFSLLSDEQIVKEASGVFTLEEFRTVELEDNGPLHYQSLLLRVDGKDPGAP